MTSGVIAELIEKQALNSHFQPIFSARTGRVYGYEALARVMPGKTSAHTPDNIADLFEGARREGVLPSLDMVCRENAFRCASAVGLGERDCYLFVNVCPETLMHPIHQSKLMDRFTEELNLSKDKVIFEITEETAVKDYDLFCRALAFYRDQGYKIAIDDFGVGYGGLKMLAMVEPDFVKIDRHFVSHINRAIVRLNLVDSIATACHRLGIQVIAEGIESDEDLQVVLDLGIEYLQGFHLGRPAPELLADDSRIEVLSRVKPLGARFDEASLIGEIVHPQPALPPSTPMTNVRATFLDHPEVMSLPVVEGERVLGMLHRKKFFETQLQGHHGFGQALSAYKTAADLIKDVPFSSADAGDTLEDVAQKTQSRSVEARYDDICVTGNGKYRGTVAISALLNAMTQRSLNLARSCNPLSGLPGNEIIQREIERRVAQNIHFDACYIDIDNFKPFNDHYGFERGDNVIKTVARLLEAIISEVVPGDSAFAGHIGGDDFLALLRPQDSLTVANLLIARFQSRLPEFHGQEDFERGCYNSINRKDEAECFDNLSLSIGIVSTEIHRLSSYAALSSLASEVKHAAKTQKGSSVFRDRRLLNISPSESALAFQVQMPLVQTPL